jgi:hypothetical protein
VVIATIETSSAPPGRCRRRPEPDELAEFVENVVRVSTQPTSTAACVPGPEMGVWTPEELTTFLRSIGGNRNEAMFRLAALTGMRRGELAGLRWTDVRLRRCGGAATARPCRHRSSQRSPRRCGPTRRLVWPAATMG